MKKKILLFASIFVIALGSFSIKEVKATAKPKDWVTVACVENIYNVCWLDDMVYVRWAPCRVFI